MTSCSGFSFLQQEGRASMKAHQRRDFLARGEVAFQFTQHAACDFRSHERMLGRTRPARFRVEHGGGGLAGIVEQRGEAAASTAWRGRATANRQVVPVRRRPFGVRPHVAFRVPLRVLLAGRHGARPRLGFGPFQDLRVGRARDVGSRFSRPNVCSVREQIRNHLLMLPMLALLHFLHELGAHQSWLGP